MRIASYLLAGAALELVLAAVAGRFIAGRVRRDTLPLRRPSSPPPSHVRAIGPDDQAKP